MKIAIEADALTNGDNTGVYFYVSKLLAALVVSDDTNQYEFVYFDSTGEKAKRLKQFGRISTRSIKWLPRRVYSLLLRVPPLTPPIDLVSGVSADVWLFPNFVRWPLLKSRGTKSVVIIYDTAYLDHPETLETKHHQLYLKQTVPRSIAKASAVVAISESTKRDLIRHYRTPADKITVITPAVDHKLFTPASSTETRQVQAKYHITGAYILYLGTIEPRKNLIALLRAYAALPAKLQQTHQLVLAGKTGWQDEAINELIAQLGDRVIKTGYLDDEADKARLYSGAAVFVFPSLFEGWGMPPLEAMACGAPVIVADNSSLPEVVGEAGIRVSAQNPAALVAAIESVLTDAKQAAAMRQKGFIQAKKFTWDKSAQQLKKLIETIP